MASHDVRDMLEISGDQQRPSKKLKNSGVKSTLKGLAREVQSLGGDNPISIVPETSLFKKRRFGIRKPAAKWGLKPFKNTARNDQSLILRHWKKVDENPHKYDGEYDSQPSLSIDDSQIEDSTFVKFNVKPKIPKYDGNIYDLKLQHPDWTKQETDYLFSLVDDYDLRWPIIWDRYAYEPPSAETSQENCSDTPKPTTRTMEDLKDRYYKVASEMMEVSMDKMCMSTFEFNLLSAMQKFNKSQETARKKYAEATFYRTKEEAREEENLLLELNRILARSEKLGYERQELYSRLDAPPTTIPIGAYTSSQGLQQLLTTLVQADKVKRGKTFSGSNLSIPGSNASNQPGNHGELRKESAAREPASATSASNKKISQGVPDRRHLSPEDEILFGVRHFDRITNTGPAFRHDKIMKPVISKSSAQQAKINNILTELRIPSRLLMPTYRVGEAFESLQHSISLLLEQKKIADKLQGEICFLKALKEERAKSASSDKPQFPELEFGEGPSKENKSIESHDMIVDESRDEEKEESPASSTNMDSPRRRSTSVTSNHSVKRRKR
ncbi:DNA methyltransferase 1-associated protein DMAP1 [Blumeria hordei DH14]|uniref:SWR1-complex protein 4 n=1 Tax=Blumeria graminis f. sp. hordei (strain DH14) TaxID=546991 RepID=N1JCA0_BLUG1|nr:DNA methyltransferase 1-associated protein DMAP1 [Blumeria hordei DH14]